MARSSASSSKERKCSQQRFRPARGPGPQGPVVDDLDGGRERRGAAIEVERSQQRRDRARRRRGAGARGAVGEELGVALVQARDGVAEAVGGEDLGAPAPALRVDLEQTMISRLDRRRRRSVAPRSPLADVDSAARARASRRGVASGSCRYVAVAERRSSERQVASDPAPVVRGAGRMVHDLVARRRAEPASASTSRAANAASSAAALRGRGVRLARGGGRGARRRLGRQLVEAGERLGVAVGVEELEARQAGHRLRRPRAWRKCRS